MGAPLTQYMAMETVRTEARILCLDSDQAHLQDMRSILADNGYQSECTLTPGRALEVMAVTRPDVILTEIEFAELEGFEVLRALRRIDPGAVIVVITSKEREPNPDRPLGLIFEYIEKPATPAVLLSHLRKAVAFAHEKRRMLGIGAHSNEDRLRSKLEWLIWKEKRQMSSRNASETLLLKNIKHSMSQGLGFGGMLTQIELLEMMAKKEGGNITIPAQAFETLLAASLDMREWLDKLDHVVDVLGRRFGTAAMSGDDFTTGITESLAAVERFRKIKNQTIISADIDFPHDISCSKEVFCFALRELLTNAFKYSPENSNIHLMKFRTGHDVTISIINDIVPMTGGVTGIPEEMEYLVFEPFFRINNTYDERFRDEELGMGIGLSVLQSAVSQSGGNLYLYEIVDHATDNTPKKRIVAEITLRLQGDGQ